MRPMTGIGLEWYKCRRRQVPLVCLGLLGAQMVWMGVFLLRQEQEDLAQGWMLLLYNLALVVGLCGSFLGLLSLLFPVGIQRCFPWGYYGLLLLVQMHWEEATRITTFSWRTPEPLDVLLLVMWWVAFGVIGYGLFARKEE